MTRMIGRGLAVLGMAVITTLAGCGGPIDPKRPPKYDYEFEPVHDEKVVTKPSRV